VLASGRTFGIGAVMLGLSLSLGLSLGLSLALGTAPARAASPVVAAAETQVGIDGDFLHQQYHENLAVGDDESGYMPGFGINIGALLPTYAGRLSAPDIYTNLGYEFNAGNINYAGHYQSGQPVDLIDNAVMNRVEARLGVGLPLMSGDEIILFAAGGYQAWNRNINQKGGIGTDEFYHSGLFGGGLKLDMPIANTLVASATGELLGLAGGGITANGEDFGRGFGVTPEERVQLGLDEAVRPRIHVFAGAFWEHFNYSGTHPEYYGNEGYIYEPFSTTTQFGANLGVGYSFN
jgi:hypothetical protein